MKIYLFLVIVFAFLGCICKAQSDSIKIVADTPAINGNAEIKTSSLSSEVPSDSANYALLYVYRPKDFYGSLISYDLMLTNSFYKELFIGRVKNNSKFVVRLYEEGQTEIYANTETRKAVILNVRFSESYYLQCEVVTGYLVGVPYLRLVHPGLGKYSFDHVKSKNH